MYIQYTQKKMATPIKAIGYASPTPQLGGFAAAPLTVSPAATIAAGQYYYAVTFTSPYGETTPTADATVSATITLGQGIQLSAIPIPATPDIIARTIYRSTVNTAGTLNKLVVINDITTTTYLDVIAIPPGGSPPTVSSSNATVSVSGYMSFSNPLIMTVSEATANGASGAGPVVNTSYVYVTNTGLAAPGYVSLPYVDANLIGKTITIRNTSAVAGNTLEVNTLDGSTINNNVQPFSSIAVSTTNTFVLSTAINWLAF